MNKIRLLNSISISFLCSFKQQKMILPDKGMTPRYGFALVEYLSPFNGEKIKSKCLSFK